jgi:hypothetical protein
VVGIAGLQSAVYVERYVMCYENVRCRRSQLPSFWIAGVVVDITEMRIGFGPRGIQKTREGAAEFGRISVQTSRLSTRPFLSVCDRILRHASVGHLPCSDRCISPHLRIAYAESISSRVFYSLLLLARLPFFTLLATVLHRSSVIPDTALSTGP